MKTREEEIKLATKEYEIPFEDNTSSILFGFEEGAKWADEHPKSPWISVKERLPERMTSRDSNGAKIINCCSKDVFGYDASYNIGRLVCYNHESELWESHDSYMIGEITYWMPIPELPKGGEK